MLTTIATLLGMALAGWLVMLGVLIIVGRHGEFLRATKGIFRRRYALRFLSLAFVILLMLMIF